MNMIESQKKLKVLITDSVDEQCVEILKSQGIVVDYRPGLAVGDIKEAIVDASALIVRSQTTVSAEILAAGKNLKVVGRAGAGVDNIDVDAATRLGIIVMNTPGGNTISTAEHTMSMMMALARNIPHAHQSLVNGKWERKKFTGTELHSKTLGIVGLGRVGMEVAKRAQAFEMSIIAYDPLISTESASKLGIELVDLTTIYRRSDFITLHSPLTDETKYLLNGETLKQCKSGVRIINCARGGIVDEAALLVALESGHVAGAALDVFETEPPTNIRLLNHPSVVVTPHLAASTDEAQEKVALQIAQQIVDALTVGTVVGSVNADIIQMAQREDLRPYLLLGEKLGALIGQLKIGNLRRLEVSTGGEKLRGSIRALSAAVLKGLLDRAQFESVNYLNAPILARERGIGVDLTEREDHKAYTHVLGVRYETDLECREIDGAVFGSGDIRIVRIDQFRLEMKPEGHLLFYTNIDRPGMLSSVSTVLANRGINIAQLTLGRLEMGKETLTVVSTDTAVPDAVLEEVSAINGVSAARRIHL